MTFSGRNGAVARGLVRMHTRTQYRVLAEECDRLAKQAMAQRRRVVLKEMAETWRELAEETGGTDGQRR